MFFGPGCEHCKELQQDYIKMADSFTKRRTDIAFGHVNCAHGDQTFRAPTEEELEEGDATAWGEYYDEGGNALEGAKDGEVVCKWYGRLDYRTAARTLFLRLYLAHFCPVFSRFFAVFSVLTPGFQKVAPKDRGAVP